MLFFPEGFPALGPVVLNAGVTPAVNEDPVRSTSGAWSACATHSSGPAVVDLPGEGFPTAVLTKTLRSGLDECCRLSGELTASHHRVPM